MSHPIDLGISVNQGTTLVLTRTILDHTEAAIPFAQLSTLVFTLYERRTGAIVNNRDHVNALPNVDSAGVLTLELLPADMAMLTGGAEEAHVVLLEWDYAAGARRGKGELLFQVRRIPRAALA